MSAAERPAYVPPLDRARARARKELADAKQVDPRDHPALAESHVVLMMRLSWLLDELDAEDAEDAERAAAYRSADSFLAREYPNLFPGEQTDRE